jgi:hypothetical protein
MSPLTLPNEAETPKPPGKTRTWWHALLVRLLDHVLSARYEVRDEVPIGRMPLRIDIVLIRRENGEIPEHLARELRLIAERLNQWTLVEFKGPTDTLECGDLDQLLACAHLFCAQQPQAIASSDLTLIILAPGPTDGFREELNLRGWRAPRRKRGLYRIRGPVFETWLISADEITGPEEPVLSLFSRVFLRDRRGIMQQLQEAGYGNLLSYVLQQIEQFKQAGEQFMIQHKDTETMEEIGRAVRAHVFETASPDELLEVLRRVPVEERLRGIPADELDDALAGLSKEELARLRELVERRMANGR